MIDEFVYDEIKTWRFRVATEPNYIPHYWNGTKEEYFRHYDITVDEVLQVIPDAIRFESGGTTVLNANLAQYEALAELPKTITDSIVNKVDQKLTLKVNLAPHSVKLIELIPQ